MKIKFDIPIYEHSVVFFDSVEESRKHLKDDEVWNFSSWTNGTESVITVDICSLKCNYFDPKYIQVLSHECCHSAIDILKRKGISVDWDNQEAFCYLQDFIIRKILDGIKRNESKKSKLQIEAHDDK